MNSRAVEAVRKKLITNTRSHIEQGIFQPIKYTEPKGSRSFSLLPLSTISNQSVSVTVGDLRVLAAKAGIPVPEPRADKECGATFNTCFYLRKAGVRLNSTTRHCKFVCLTDGYSCCFLLQKKIKKKMAGTTLTPSKMKKKVQG